MQSNNYDYQVQIKRQEFEREIRQRILVKITLTRRHDDTFQPNEMLARFGGWLIRQGEYLETRYSQCTEACVPVRTANAR
ncbi:MAG: hypothetical protein ABI690_23480 [Chloroflexota bacterium]